MRLLVRARRVMEDARRLDGTGPWPLAEALDQAARDGGGDRWWVTLRARRALNQACPRGASRFALSLHTGRQDVLTALDAAIESLSPRDRRGD